MKLSPAFFFSAAVVFVALVFGIWCYLVWQVIPVQFQTPGNLAGYLLRTPEFPVIQWRLAEAFAIVLVPIAAVVWFFGDCSTKKERIVRGMPLVTAEALARITTQNSPKPDLRQVEIGGVPIPLECETRHVLSHGGTGSGKTVMQDGLLASVLRRGDRCIVIDPNGHGYSHFGLKGDVVLNPLDKRSPGWSVWNEVRNDHDIERVAAAMIPSAATPDGQEWRGYARMLLGAIMRTLARDGDLSMERLLYVATRAPMEELRTFLAGSAVTGWFESGAEKPLSSARFVLISHLSAYEKVNTGSFSLRSWLSSGKGNLYITWREDMLEVLTPLASMWLEILMSEVLTVPEKEARPLWLFLDELASLERLDALEGALTKGRKSGLRVVAGIQSISQLSDIYGQHGATTIRSCFRNVVALGCSSAEPGTAKAVAAGFGQVEIERIQTTISKGRNGNSTSTNRQRVVRDVVTPMELMSLAPLHGYLKFMGKYPPAKVKLVPHGFKPSRKPFVAH